MPKSTSSARLIVRKLTADSLIFFTSYDVIHTSRRRGMKPRLFQLTPAVLTRRGSMNTTLWAKPYENRRTFLGGSDARIIMGSDEAA